MKIDLHVHTDASDGKDPVELVMQDAKNAGLDVLALTDHDNTVNWDSASTLAHELGLGLIPGMEMTTRTHTRYEVDESGKPRKFGSHLLSYLHDPSNAELLKVLETSREGRVTRLIEITELVNARWRVDWQEVLQQASNAYTLGRPSLADALVKRYPDLFRDRSHAFDVVWNENEGFYVPNRNVPDTIEAIELIRRAGGVPILAHPMSRAKFRKDGDVLPEREFAVMVEAGLAGFEVHHREIGPKDRIALEAFCTARHLIITGSSDYHGRAGKDNRLAENTTSPEMLKRILQQASGYRPVNLPMIIEQA